MARGAGISLDGRKYNIVEDHETYVVSDVPAHPDSDARMERRVHYDSWLKGILKRRASNSLQDQSIVSLNIYNRIERAGDGFWFPWGGDTRMGDRIFGQRLVNPSQSVASAPLFFGDASVYSFVGCKQHFYSVSGVVNGIQQFTLSKDFSAITPTENIVTAVAFKGRIYVATAQLTNGVPDPSLPQPMYVWDQTGPTANWTHPPQALNAPVWPTGASTTVATPFAKSGATSITVGATTDMPGAGNFDVVIDNEIIQVTKNNATTLNIITRGRLGTAAVAHQAGGTSVTYNPGISVGGTAGQTRWQYYVTTNLVGQDSPPSQTQTILFGASTLSATNYNILTFNTVTGQSYTIFRSYAGGNPNSVGIIQTGIVGTGSPVTFNDTGLAVTGVSYQITPQFAIGDIGRAFAFVVIRNTLWRAAGPRMWAWDGQSSAWTGESIIGDINTNITDLDVYNDSLVIFKQDGIYTMNRTGDVFTIFPNFKTLGFNPRPIGQWQGAYYFASDVGMVWQWDGNNVKSIGFDYAEAYPFPDGTFGLPNAVTVGIGMPNYFLVGFNKWNSNNNSAFYFAWDGVGWHPFHFDPNFIVTGLGMTGGNQIPANPAIQFGKATWNNTSYIVHYLTQPTLDPYIVNSYDTMPQTIFLPVDSGIISDEWKVLEGLRVFVENSTKGIVRIAYSSDDNIFTQTYTDLGPPENDRTPLQTFVPAGQLPVYRKIMFKVTITPDPTVSTTITAGSNNAALPQGTINVVTTNKFPVAGLVYVQTNLGLQAITYTGITASSFTGCSGGSGTMLTGYTVQSPGSSTTPIIRMVMHRYKQRETQRKSWTMALFLEEGQMTPTRNREHRTSKQMLKHLNDARKNRNLVEFIDIVGDRYMVYVESVGESLKTYRLTNQQTSFVAKVVLVEPAEVAAE